MININLLPEVLRKKERMPLSQLLGIIGGIVVFCAIGFFIFNYSMFIIPGLERNRSNLTRQKSELQKQAEELKQLNNEISKLSSYVDAVRTLYRQRTVWSKILLDLKNIVNFDQTMGELNPEMRYIWLTRLNGRGKEIALNGFATASTQVVAMQIPERLLQGILSYAPVSLPEKDEEARLQEELKTAQMEHDALRRENPELPLQGPRETGIQQRLAEIKNIKSGGIAMQPFSELLVPSSLRLVNATWSAAPQPPKKSEAMLNLDDFPKQAWSFNITMQLK